MRLPTWRRRRREQMRSPLRGVGGGRKRRETSIDRSRGGRGEERELAKDATDFAGLKPCGDPLFWRASLRLHMGRVSS
jgi:hypothetical protein